jgi:hypothetical protein
MTAEPEKHTQKNETLKIIFGGFNSAKRNDPGKEGRVIYYNGLR